MRKIEECFAEFTKKHYLKIIKKLDLEDEEDLKPAIEIITKLNPKPGGSYSGNNRIVEHIVPDFAIKIIEGELELTLNGRNAPELHVSREYSNMMNFDANCCTRALLPTT